MIPIIAIKYRPLWAILIPAGAAVLIRLSARQPNLREGWTLLASSLLFLTVVSLTRTVLAQGVIRLSLVQLVPGIDLAFRADPLGMIFATTAAVLWILVSLYSIGYMRSLKEHAQTRFYFFFAIALCGAMGIAFSANLLTLFIFYEILTLSTYPLVAHTESPEALSAGHKYLAYLLGGGVFLLLAILLTYHLVGTTDFSAGGILSPALAAIPHWGLQLLFISFLIGFAKAAWIPLHSWLPSAMVAPTPVSGLLHAVAVVKAGVFGIIRVVCYVYGIDLMHELNLGITLACVAAFTLIVANLYAIGQDNLKRMLAYSTINQLALILLGTALLSPAALTGALIHIPFHGFMKITLFLCAGAITVMTGKRNISEMAGIGRILPLTLGAFLAGALGMCGAPPLAGFISKWHICLGAIESGQLFFLGIILVGSFLDVVYFFPVIRKAFFGKVPAAELFKGDREPQVALWPKAPLRRETEKPLYFFMLVPLALTALFSVLLCLYPHLFGFYDLARLAVHSIFNGG